MLGLLSGFALLVASALASAADSWIRCENCQPQQAQALAELVLAPATVGVYNLSQGWWSKFDVRFEGGRPGCIERGQEGKNEQDLGRGNHCEYRNYAYPVEISAHEAQLLQELHALHVDTQGTLKERLFHDHSSINLPPCSQCFTGQITAYDVARDVSVRVLLRQSVQQALDTRTIVSRVHDILARLGEIHILGGDMTIIIRVDLHDGSHVVVTYTETDREGTIEVVKDPLGEPVHTAPGPHVLGTYEFQHRFQVENFLEHMRLIGVPITGPLGPNTSRTAICEAEVLPGGGIQVTCRRGGAGQ